MAKNISGGKFVHWREGQVGPSGRIYDCTALVSDPLGLPPHGNHRVASVKKKLKRREEDQANEL